MTEADYKYDYPIKAIRYNKFDINVRKMRKDEMEEDGITYYADRDGIIYTERERDFRLL